MAHAVAPGSWGVSLFPRRVCLNVGGLAVLQFYTEEILFVVTGRMFKSLRRRDKASFRFNRKYKDVPDAIEGWLSSEVLSKRYSAFRQAHEDLIERAARKRKICWWWYAHSPSVLEVLRDQDFTVPDPAYFREQRFTVPDPEYRPLYDVDELDYETEEGRRMLRTHLVPERDPQLVRRKKKSVMKETGRLACEVCTFDFAQFYGSLGEGFAEVHHIRPVAAGRGPRKVRLVDLAIVCSNCHRMLHRRNPVLALDELRAKIRDGSRTRECRTGGREAAARASRTSAPAVR